MVCCPPCDGVGHDAIDGVHSEVKDTEVVEGDVFGGFQGGVTSVRRIRP